MANEILAAVIGVVGGGALTALGAGITGVFSSGRHAKTLEDHEERLDDHEQRLKAMPADYVPRTELTARLDALGATAKSTEDWVRFLVKKEVVPPEGN